MLKDVRITQGSVLSLSASLIEALLSLANTLEGEKKAKMLAAAHNIGKEMKEIITP